MTPLTVLFEDAEALVIDKPAGLPIDRPRAGGVSLDDHLDAMRFGFQRTPAAVHRLDQDTSGCLLLARNAKAHKRYAAAFEARLVGKVYLGIVAGEVAEDSGTIALNLSKISSAERGWRMIPARAGKPAITHWRVVDRREGPEGVLGGKPITLVEFRPETGRTHQIRVHALAGLGAALVGDPVYGTGEGARRTMLHAAALTVPREGKPPIIATAPLPADFLALGFADPAPTDPAPTGPVPTGAAPTEEPDSCPPTR